MTIETEAVVTTEPACSRWRDTEAFAGVDNESWEPELRLDEDIARHVRSGGLVPVTIETAGPCQVLIVPAAEDGGPYRADIRTFPPPPAA